MFLPLALIAAIGEWSFGTQPLATPAQTWRHVCEYHDLCGAQHAILGTTIFSLPRPRAYFSATYSTASLHTSPTYYNHRTSII